MAKEKSVDLQNIIDEGLEKPIKRTIGAIVDDVLETQEQLKVNEEKITEPVAKKETTKTTPKQTQPILKEQPEVLDEILVKVIEKAKTEEESEQLEEQTSNIAGAPVELTDSPKFEFPDEYDGLDPGIVEYAKDDFLKHKSVDGNVYETGWVEIENFNSAILGEKIGETITHGLNIERDKLETKIHLRVIDKQSTSTLEEIQLEINSIKDERGIVVKHISDDNTIIATAEKGIHWASALENKVIIRTSENFDFDKHRVFYKITISKPIDIQKLVKEVITQGPRGIPLYPTMGPISTSGLFNLAKNEIVTGRPAFNGGTSGVNSPFTVDSNFLIPFLNADLLDGNEAAAFATVSHNHDSDYLGLTAKATDSELLDNHDSTYFAIDGHIHDDIYYTETELDAGQLDNRYYTETEHIDVSAGIGDASKPIKLDAAGHVDLSMINDSDINHANLTGTHNLTTDINHDTISGFAEEEHRVINDVGTSTTELFSASKIINDYLGITAKAADSELLDNHDSTYFSIDGHDHNADYLGITAKATDSELLDNHDSTYFSIDGHDHNAIYYTKTEINTTLGGYFKLNESETVTGRPAFNGGITGTSSPFTVDSTYKVANLNADLLDGLTAASFIRSNANTNVSAHTEWQDTKEVRLGNEADFRMMFNGTQTILKSYYHGAPILFQGENAGGVTNAMLYMDPDNAISLYYGGNIKLETVSAGAKVHGTLESTTALKSPALELTAAGSKFYSPVGGEDSLGTGHWRGNSSGGANLLDQNPTVAGSWYTITFSNAPTGARAAWAYCLLTSGGGLLEMSVRKYGDTVGVSGTQVMYANTLTYLGVLVRVPLDSSKRGQIGSGQAIQVRVYETIFYDV